MGAWKNKIVSHDNVNPNELLANKFNFRVHLAIQEDAVKEVIHKIGIVKSVLVNVNTGHIIDGHLRVSLAIKEKQASVPVEYVNLTPEEELMALKYLDQTSAMVTIDPLLFKSLEDTLNVELDIDSLVFGAEFYDGFHMMDTEDSPHQSVIESGKSYAKEITEQTNKSKKGQEDPEDEIVELSTMETSGKTNKYVKVAGQSVPVTDDEESELKKRIKDYTDRNGVLFGFFSDLLGI